MPSTLPAGDTVPQGGVLSSGALETLGTRPFGAYVHIPFCMTRCGYCDFNTYTATELGGGASQAAYADTVIAEIDLAGRVLGDSAPTLETIFFGGGTPTMLPPGDLVRIVERLRDAFGVVDEAEVTTEANPDSVDSASLARLRDGGINRVSFGMQSAVPAVLATLDRTHDPERVRLAVEWARAAGFEQVSLDLIYGTPGESIDDWQTSLAAVTEMRPDHVSAYALIVEDGTALAQRVARGQITVPDDDEMADKYAMAESELTGAGLRWYELSNWARDDTARCRHNELYWSGAHWWGFGPGAHSHVGGTRWWNVKHPAAYAGRLDSGDSPAHAHEVLDVETQRVERVLLESRLRAGLCVCALDDAGRAALPGLVADGLIGAETCDRLVLTLRGRLLADAVVRRLLP